MPLLKGKIIKFPINNTMVGERFELPNPKERIYSPPRLATSLPHHGWLGTESNRRHLELQSSALPTELPSQHFKNGPDGI